MNMLKKVSLVNIIALAVSLMVPAAVLASHVSPVLEIDSASLVTAGSAGGTALKLYFWVRDQLPGHASAPAVNTWLEIKTTGTSCNAFDGAIVKRLIGGRGGIAAGETFNPGFFYGPYVWDGSDLAGNLMSPGLYCFQFRSYTTDPAGMPIALLSPPYTGVISLGAPQAARVLPPTPRVVPISQILVSAVSGSPVTVPGGQARVSYTVYQTIRNGLTFRILDASSAVVSTPGSRPGAVLPDSTGSFTWNGRNTSNVYVVPGTYRYQLTTTDGPGLQVLGQGNITVQTAPLPPAAMACSDGLDNDGDSRIDLTDPGCVNASDNDETNAPVADVIVSNISASPSTFSPAQNELTTISFTLSEPARVGVEIYRANGRHRTLMALPAPGAANNGVAGINTVAWNGFSEIFNSLLNVSPDDNGSYEIRVTAAGASGNTVTPPYGFVTINNVAAPSIDVSNVSVSPSTFNVASGQTVTVNYTLGNVASNQAYFYVNRGGNLIHVSNTTSAAIGQNQFVWNGYSSEQNRQLNLTSDDGIYTVSVVAYDSNGNYDFDSSGRVTISNTAISNLVISNISASPSTFRPSIGESTAIGFNLSAPATNVSTTISNASGAVVYSASFSGTLPQGGNQFVWSGVNNQGRFLTQASDNGVYTIRVDGTGANGVQAFSTGTVSISNGATGNLVISNISASPSTFNPSSSQSTTVMFNLSGQATNVSATMLNPSSSVVHTISLGNLSQGQNQFVWNGYSSNFGRLLSQTNDNGAYTIRVTGTGADGVTVSSTGTVYITNGTVSSGFTLLDLGPSKNPFNPEIGESTDFKYSLAHDADVKIRVYSPGTTPVPSTSLTPIRTLLSLSLRSSGANSQPWNGRDDFGNLVVSSSYPYLVEATSRQNGASAYFIGYVSVNRSSGLITLTDLGPSAFTFNPSRGETVTIRFELNQTDAPTVSVLQGGATGTSLGTLAVTLESSASNRYVYRAIWNGKNASSQIMANDTYAYRIRATSGGSTQERIGYVRVDNGTGGGQTGTGCSGYSDVASNDPLCPAIQFVVSRGIFLGDAGRNTLRPSDKLSRAETAKVLQSAFGYSLESYDEFRDDDLGFSDLDESAWYMPYMKTFVIRGVMRGYPDGKMRPIQKMKTTELFKIFVEGVFEAPRALANFTLNRNVRTAPFNDTPVKSDTKWYLPYAEFAERYDLAPSEPYFYPAREITRGKVILLIYEANSKNVISYGVTNPSARTASQFTYTYGSRSPTYYRSSSSGSYVTDSIY